MVENNFPPNIIREERQRLLFFRSKRMRSATGMENAWAREEGREEWDRLSRLEHRVLNHPRDICVHIDVFSEGDTVGERTGRVGGGWGVGEGLRAGKGFFLVAPSIVTPQLLDGVLIQRLAGSRFAESLVETTLSFHPRPGHPFVSRRRKSPATEKGHGEEGSFCIRGYIYVRGNNNRRWRRVCVPVDIYTGEGGSKSRKYIRFILCESVKLDFPNNV